MYTKLFDSPINFKVQTKQLPTKGNLVYEYNPFRNYRLDEDLYEYNGDYYTLLQLYEQYGISLKCSIEKNDNGDYTIKEGDQDLENYENILKETDGNALATYKLKQAIKDAKITNWFNVPDNMTDPMLREKGELVDFITDQLDFDLNHPVSLLPQASYDGSVNLIINDGKNSPKLINSRFSSTGKNTYEIIDRKGNDDANIYDRGSEFLTDTSLYKIVNSFPKVSLTDISLGGNLKVGNYVFYFRLSDADGNESDFIEESGSISIFKGLGSHSSISTGERDNNSAKQVRFQIQDLDTSFSYVTVYYSRNSAEINQNYVTEYAKIDRKYPINNAGVADILITGFERVDDITNEEINLTYSLVDCADAHAICQNRLFLANVKKPNIPYEELQDLSLRFLPSLKEEQYEVSMDHNYNISSITKGYIDPLFIYNKTGYWGNELYRFGIAYIMKNGELSPVFNIRGGYGLTINPTFSDYPIRKETEDGKYERQYIPYNDSDFLIDQTSTNSVSYENAKGVISLSPDNDTNTIYSVKITATDEVIQELKQYVKGFFFVRQKRIPLVLAQGITIGIDKNSRTPTIPTAQGILENIKEPEKTYLKTDDINNVNYISEGFLSRYRFKFEKKKSSIWKNIGLIAGIVAMVVAAAAATIFTMGGGAVAWIGVGSVISSISGAVGGGLAGTVLVTATATAVGATIGAVAGGLVGAAAAGIHDAMYSMRRIGEKKSYDGRKTEAPDGYKIVEDSKESRQLTHNFQDRIIIKDPEENDVQAILCPEYEVNPPHYNCIFTGNEHLIASTKTQGINMLTLPTNYFSNQNRHFYIPQYFDQTEFDHKGTFTIIPMEDDKKIGAIGNLFFRARAGEAEEAWKYQAVSKHHLKDTSFEYAKENDEGRQINSDIIRGSFGSFLAFNNESTFGPAETVNIYTPGYSQNNIDEYLQIRMRDASPFMAVTYRIDINKLSSYQDQITILNEAQQSNEYSFNLYRGDCYLCQFTHRIIRNFNSPSAPYNDIVVDQDSWRTHYAPNDAVKNGDINLGDVNAVQLGMWVTFRLRSTYNLNILTLDESNIDESSMCGHSRGRYPQIPMSVDGSYKIKESNVYNRGFMTTLGERYNFEVPDVPYIKDWYGTRIMYSDIFVQDSFQNGFRQFWATNYRDYTREYGQITKLLELRGNLVCVFEHGVALIPVNERAVAGEGSGGLVYINTQNVLPENPKIISDTFGSQWSESVIKTPRGIYGVDTVGKKIWRTNGTDFEILSDFKIQEFLNNNISLSESELTPIIGVRNVKTHFNKFKNDVMFTFYDNLYGFEEKVWNLCFNENLQKWITFYSWVPSYSDNIYNQFFSFDRNTSKWIAKIGTSNSDNSFSDGIVLDNNIIPNNLKVLVNQELSEEESKLYCKVIQTENEEEKVYYYPKVGKLSLANRTLPEGDNIKVFTSYVLERDNYGNYKNFTIVQEEDKFYLCLRTDAINLCTEKYQRKGKDENITDLNTQLEEWKQLVLSDNGGNYIKNDRGIRKEIKSRENEPQLVTLLNIRAEIGVSLEQTDGNNVSFQEAYMNGFKNDVAMNAGYYQSVVAVIPKYNMQFLTTDFWKHGQAGIIDTADKIRPTYWYGKQHPFEFEFVVANKQGSQKIFDSLEIISNKAAPESFHYEITGEGYEFAKDKKNMYIRQEATKELYQYNGSDIVFDTEYSKLEEEHRELDIEGTKIKHFDKSTIFPLYYARRDTINEIEDYYHLHGSKDKYSKTDSNFSALAGAEIIKYDNLNEYHIWNHAKAVDVEKEGYLRGNMRYKEDKWQVQINPINYVQKNESEEDWENIYRDEIKEDKKALVPVAYNIFPPPSEINLERGINLPEDWARNVISWGDLELINKETKMRDKYIKIRVRYSGEDLAIISAINTLYSISYA